MQIKKRGVFDDKRTPELEMTIAEGEREGQKMVSSKIKKGNPEITTGVTAPRGAVNKKIRKG